MTIHRSIDPAAPQVSRIAEAVAVIRRGEIVAIPTETSYGLATDSGSFDAVRRVNELKRKPADASVLLLAANVEQARSLIAFPVSPLFEALARQFWPGPVTIVGPAAAHLSLAATSGIRTVAVRVPGLLLARQLAEQLGRPITGVSANLHGQPPFHSAELIASELGPGVALVLDGGATGGGPPSTIVDVTTCPPRVLRIGAIPLGALAPYLDCV